MNRIAPIAVLTAALATTASAADPSAWTFKDLGEAGGGAHYFVAQAPSSQNLANALGKPEKASLAIRCDQKGFFITFLWPTYVTADTYDDKVINVDLKLDSGKTRRLRLHKTDQAAVALGKEGYRLLKDIQKAHDLSVHLPDFAGGQDASFQIEGVDQIYQRVTSFGCGKN